MMYYIRCVLPLLLSAAIFVFTADSASADTNAVTVQTVDGAGAVTGAVGFSFTPTTNLNVTTVGYHDGGAANPIITFWSGTNFAIASYSLPPGSGSGLMITTNVALTLLAGQPYAITVQDGPLSSNKLIGLVFSTAPDYQVAAELTGFDSKRVNPSGGFEDLGTSTFYEGANFTFTTTSSVPAAPELTIALTNADTAVVSWPDSPGFVLQANLALETTNWFLVTNAVNTANGTNWIVDSPLENKKFFRLLHP